MNIIVINGSPHGNNGVTAHYHKYLELKFPEYKFNVFEVGKKIRKIERDTLFFNEILQQIENADAVIWAFPVYTMLIPSQLKRFIELLFENEGKKLMRGKLGTSISTSANFYDHTAHDYIQGISADLGLKYVRGFSAEMKDILSETGQNNFLGFARDFFWKVNQGDNLEDRTILPIHYDIADLSKLSLPLPLEKTGNKKIIIVSDAEPEDKNLHKMLKLFELQVSHQVEYIQIRDINIKGGCLGCLHCGDGDPCIYKDEYEESFKRVKSADIVIYAGAIKDRYFSARFKMFIDRYFSNGHRYVLNAGLFGYIVSGPLNQLPSMYETLEANIEVGHLQRLGIISDDYENPEVVANNITNMAKNMEHWSSQKGWRASPTFLGVGGHKVFRDIVYERRGVMTADYRFYKEKNLLDFPNKNYANRIINKIMLIMQKIPRVKKDFIKNMNKNRIKPYIKVLEDNHPSHSK